MQSRDPSVVLVDARNQPLGLMARSLAHRGSGHRHRAFTVLVFDQAGRLAMGRRAASKTLWPGAFDATVASHPLPGESIDAAARRRLCQELGWISAPHAAKLQPLGRFDYQIRDGARGAEAELCFALLAQLPADAQLFPEPAEIDHLDWRPPAELLADPSLWPTICPWAWPALELLARHPSPFAATLAAPLRLARPQLQLATNRAFANGRLAWP